MGNMWETDGKAELSLPTTTTVFSVMNIWFRDVEIKKVFQSLMESEQKLCEEIIENKDTSQLLKYNMY